MIDRLKEIKSSLQEDIEQIEENGGDMKRASWRNQEGVLISGKDAKLLLWSIDTCCKQIELLEVYKNIFGSYPFERKQ